MRIACVGASCARELCGCMTWFLRCPGNMGWDGGDTICLMSRIFCFVLFFHLSCHFALVGFGWVVDIASMTREPLAGSICAKKAWLWRDELDRAQNPGGVEVTFPSNPTRRRAPWASGRSVGTEHRPDPAPKNAHKNSLAGFPHAAKPRGDRDTHKRRPALPVQGSIPQFILPTTTHELTGRDTIGPAMLWSGD